MIGKKQQEIQVRRKNEIVREVEINQHEQSKREIVETRQKLEDFTLRDFADGLFGEEFTATVYGKEGGQIRMGDLKMNMVGTAMPGELAMGLNEDQMIAIVQESHPGLTREAAKAMLVNAGANQQALSDLRKHVSEVDRDHARAFKTLSESEGRSTTWEDLDKKSNGKEGL